MNLPARRSFAVILIVALVNVIVVSAAVADVVTPKQTAPLFNGRNLDGWKFVSRDATADAAAIWTAKDGVIACAGKPNGYARTIEAYRNYVLRFEWRWPAAAGGNSGVFVHVNEPDRVWPLCLEVQLKAGDAGSVRANGGSKVNELDSTAKDPRNVALRSPGAEKPAGEWNVCEVVCRGDTMKVSINGVLQNEVTGTSVSSGAIALQAEGAPVEFRNIVIAPLTAESPGKK